MATVGPNQPRRSIRSVATVQISTAADGVGDSINITGLKLSSIEMSTAWTAANIGFKASLDGTNYYPVYDTSGNFLTYPTSASRVVAFDPAVFSGFDHLQLVSETSAGVAVAQAAARTLRLGLVEY